jgi:hypothetical protein
MKLRLTAGALGLLSMPVPGWLAAQYVPEPSALSTGFEARYYYFGPNLPVKSLGQIAVPLAVVVPAGRAVFDAGAWIAATTLSRHDGFRETVTGLTDTQVRASLILGSDDVVLSAMVNLPTGARDLSITEYAVLAAASSSFFAFPVNAYGSGASVTLGAAGAFQAGAWNMGLAASARLSDDYTPFHDIDGAFTYQSGLEVRFRGGADRLIGNGRLSLGLTFSTFSTDEFATGTGASGVYRPGRRIIGEASYATLVGPATLTGYLWDFYRTAGDSAGFSTGNSENLLAAGIAGRMMLKPTLFFEPGAEFRWYSPEEGSALMLEFSGALRIRLSPRYTLIPVARLDLGRLHEPEPGIGHAIRGGGVSIFLRWLL